MARLELVPEEMVQELAQSCGAPPLRYIQREERRPINPSPPPADVPVVDLSRLMQPDGDEEAAKLSSALQSWGLFQAVGHGVPASLLDEMRNLVKEFFQLPKEEKEKYSNVAGDEYSFEGYGVDQITTEDQILDWNDRLFLLVQPEDKRNLVFWPESPSFRGIMHEFAIKMRKVVYDILKATAKTLELDEDYFVNKFGDGASVGARLNYYPSCPSPELVLGVKPHSDNSTVTLILQDDVEGLQVFKDGQWILVPIIPHAFVTVFGDQMEIMSNGIIKAPVHRVVTDSEKARISVAMFYDVDAETEIGPAEGLAGKERLQSYKKIKAKDYADVFFLDYAQGIRSIDRVRV